MKTPFICLLVGPSGSGKTAMATLLALRNGWSQLDSYTTRAPRHDGEKGHTFVTTEEFEQLQDIVAYTYYNDHHYGATAQQIDESELYVVDVPGVESLVENYKGDKKFIVCIPWADEDIRRQRMFRRGDSIEKIEERIEYDRYAFAETWKLGGLVGEENVILLDSGNYVDDALDVEDFLRAKGFEWTI